eukprot:356151-Rhodomonas_salina.2
MALHTKTTSTTISHASPECIWRSVACLAWNLQRLSREVHSMGIQTQEELFKSLICSIDQKANIREQGLCEGGAAGNDTREGVHWRLPRFIRHRRILLSTQYGRSNAGAYPVLNYNTVVGCNRPPIQTRIAKTSFKQSLKV